MRTGEYGELKRLVDARGLLQKDPASYTARILLNLAMLGAGVLCLALVQSFYLQLLNAVFLAVVFTQIAFISHDSGHHQICRSAFGNELICLLHSNLLLGMSGGWWTQKHNLHHVHPNLIDLDPDLDLPTMAPCIEMAQRKKGIWRFIVKYQAYFFVPSLTMMSWALRAQSFRAVLQKTVARPRVEALLIALNLPVYIGLPIYFAGPAKGIVLILVHQALFGFFMASVFASNHKGMPTMTAGDRMNFLRQQVLTARNIRPSFFTDYWFGALNYQIEHHLFPTIPRSRMSEVRRIVQDFCRQRSIEYCETGVIESYREVLRYLDQVGRVLRNSSRMTERNHRDDAVSATGCPPPVPEELPRSCSSD